MTMLTGEEINAPSTYLVFFNGLVVGVHERPAVLVDNVRRLRRAGKIGSSFVCYLESLSFYKHLIGEFVSVYLNLVQKAVYISSDGGRVCRPLLVLEYGVIIIIILLFIFLFVYQLFREG